MGLNIYSYIMKYTHAWLVFQMLDEGEKRQIFQIPWIHDVLSSEKGMAETVRGLS